MSEVVSRGLRVVLIGSHFASRESEVWMGLDGFGGFVTPLSQTLNEVHTLATLAAHVLAVFSEFSASHDGQLAN